MEDDSNSKTMDTTSAPSINNTPKKERPLYHVPVLDLKPQSSLCSDTQPILVVQSPKTPTLSRKLKAVSLDGEPQSSELNTLEVSRDVFSMPNSPKKQQIKQKHSNDFPEGTPKTALTPSTSGNLKKFASNNSISGSQILKTLPEVNALQDFSDCSSKQEFTQKIRAKGLLERRGSNVSLTIDLGTAQSLNETKPVPLTRQKTARSVSNLNLSSTTNLEETCICDENPQLKEARNQKHQNTCSNCTIYESVPKFSTCKAKCQNLRRCAYCQKTRRKSLSNENLYVPPCGHCEQSKDEWKNGKGNNHKPVNLRHPDLDAHLQISDVFKSHLQNVEYLQTAGNILSIPELKQACQTREQIHQLHEEFWKVPLNTQDKCFVPGSQSKNRYKTVLPNEHSRVYMPNNGYIQANYIKGPDYMETTYIATQGPLSNTCDDFWEMIWYTECKCIVMLTHLVEKCQSKCEPYFPLGKLSPTTEKTYLCIKTAKIRDKFTFDSGKSNDPPDIETYQFEETNELHFGKYHVKFISRRDMDECQIRQLELRKLDLSVEPRIIYHYWYNGWPDHHMANAELVLKMALDILCFLDGDGGSGSFKDDNNDDCVEKMAFESLSDKKTYCDEQQQQREDVDYKGKTVSTNNNSTTRFSFELCDISQASSSSSSSFMECSSAFISTSSTQDYQDCHMESLTSCNSNNNSNCVVTRHDQFVDNDSEMRSVDDDDDDGGGGGGRSNSSAVKVATTFNFVQPQPPPPPSASSSSSTTTTNYNCQIQSRDDSISDFHKETLSNRCSLDSKLGNLNKLTDLKTQLQLTPTTSATTSSHHQHSSTERRKSYENTKLPIVVHCSAGIGRTGCFLAILNGIQQLRKNNNVDILAILCSLRLSRGGMIQTAEQYELVHKVLRLYIENNLNVQ